MNTDDNGPIRSHRSAWLRPAGIIASYVVTAGGIILLGWVVSRLRSWVVIALVVIHAIPLFPTIQLFLQGKRKAGLPAFARTYAREYASVVVQFLALLVVIPLTFVAVAYRLIWALLIAMGIGLALAALQLMGIPVGRQLTSQDLLLMLGAFVLTALVLAAARRIKRIWQEHEQGLFEFVAVQLRKVRDYFLVE
jgi:hypothetical protein